MAAAHLRAGAAPPPRRFFVRLRLLPSSAGFGGAGFGGTLPPTIAPARPAL
eukprot:gene3467-3269_t